MWPFDADPQTAAVDPTQATNVPASVPADNGWGAGMFTPGSLLSNPDFRRHAAYDALTNAGMALIGASAPSPYPQNLGSMFGALAGGAAQGVQGSADRYMKMATIGAQLQNMRLRQQMMQGALNSPDPVAAPQNASQVAAAPASMPATSGAPNALGITDNNIGNVEAPKGSPTRFQQVPDFNSGVALTVKNVQSYPDRFNGGKPMDLTQIADHWTEDNKKGWAANVSLFSGLPLNQPLDLSNPEVAAKVAMGIHGAEKGAKAVQPPAAYVPGVQLAQSGNAIPQGGDQQPTTGNQPGVIAPPPPQVGGVQLPPMPQPRPIPPRLNAMLVSGDKGMEDLAKSQIARIKTADANDMERWKAGVALLQHNQTTALEQQRMIQTERNSKVTAAGPNSELATAETNIESAKERGKEEERTRFVYGSSDWANKTPDELRKQANPEAVTLVDAIQNGQSINNIATRAGGSGGMDINKNDLIALGGKLYGKKFDTNYGIQKAEFALNMAPGKDGGKQLASISNATQHITDAAEAYNDLKNGKYPLANRIFNAAKTASGWGPEKGFDAIMQPVATEMARVISGSSDNSITERDALREITGAWGSPEQMQTVFNKYAGLAQKRLNTKYAEAKVYGYDKDYIDKRLGEYGQEALSKIPTSVNLVSTADIMQRIKAAEAIGKPPQIGPKGEGYDYIKPGQYLDPQGNVREKK